MRLAIILGYHRKELELGRAVRQYFGESKYCQGKDVVFYEVQNPNMSKRQGPDLTQADLEIRQFLAQNQDIEGLIDLHFGGGGKIQDVASLVGNDGTLLFGEYHDMNYETARLLARGLRDIVVDRREDFQMQKYSGTPLDRCIPAIEFEGIISGYSRRKKNGYYRTLLEVCSKDIAIFYNFVMNNCRTRL